MAVRTVYSGRSKVTEAGVAAYMRQVFNYMTGGVAISGVVAYFTVTNQALLSLALSSSWLFMIVWLGFGFFGHKLLLRLQPTAALGVFAAFSALTGFSLAPIALVYTGESVFMAFAMASVMFGGASLYGYVTKKSLSGWGNFLMMGVMGLFGAAIVSWVSTLLGYHMSTLSFIISLVAVPLFSALTAWETNQLKETYAMLGGDEVQKSRTAIFGAASLYMNFVVIFIHLLSLIGERR